MVIDAVLMYAQRGHGKRSSYYSDYTFGVWSKGETGEELVPVGKAYFGFTDEELLLIDRFVRRNTVDREYRRSIRPGARGRARTEIRVGAGSCFRRAAALDAPQVRYRDAISAHQSFALG
jgi:ATP-dependent DNA ligase